MTIKRFQVGPRMSQAVVYNGMAYLAGQVADDTTADVTGQTRQILASIDRLLAAAGSDKTNSAAPLGDRATALSRSCSRSSGGSGRRISSSSPRICEHSSATFAPAVRSTRSGSRGGSSRGALSPSSPPSRATVRVLSPSRKNIRVPARMSSAIGTSMMFSTAACGSASV